VHSDEEQVKKSTRCETTHLKIKVINTRSFEEQGHEPCTQTFFILSIKRFMFILVKFKSSRNNLNILREKTKCRL